MSRETMSEAGNRRFSLKMPSVRAGAGAGIAIRALIIVGLLITGGVIALLGERLLAGSGAASNEVVLTPFQDWRLACSVAQNGNCALTSEVMRDTGGTLVALAINDSAPGSPLSVTVPLGIVLEPGLGFSIGNEPLRVRPYETCVASGCFALVTLDADTVKSMNSNMNGQVVVVPGNGSPVTIPFSLKGFAEGYAALQKAKAQRASIFSFLGR